LYVLGVQGAVCLHLFVFLSQPQGQELKVQPVLVLLHVSKPKSFTHLVCLSVQIRVGASTVFALQQKLPKHSDEPGV
jgi:hypothetical protein